MCGTNADLDSTHLIAEKNWPFPAEALDQTNHPNSDYRTHVFEIVTDSAQEVMTSSDCPEIDPGLVSLFLAPASAQCNAATLKQPSGSGFHHLMVSTSCDLTTVIKKFIADKEKFQLYF